MKLSFYFRKTALKQRYRDVTSISIVSGVRTGSRRSDMRRSWI